MMQQYMRDPKPGEVELAQHLYNLIQEHGLHQIYDAIYAAQRRRSQEEGGTVHDLKLRRGTIAALLKGGIWSMRELLDFCNQNGVDGLEKIRGISHLRRVEIEVALRNAKRAAQSVD